MAEKKSATVEMVRKITIKTVMTEAVDIIDLNKKKSIDLCQIYGAVTAFKPGASDLGSYVRFIGEFKAVNLKTGEIFGAPACILPRFLEEQLTAVCTPDNFPVAFGFQIGVKWDDSAATKYVYTAAPLVTPKSSNVMAELEQKLAPVLKLTGPKK